MLVLLFAPESVVHPSFQMSFAATLALVAGYERGAIKLRASTDSSFGARAALWGVNEIVGLTVASLLAGLATTPYAAYHFHRIAPYGVLANLLAMPIVSAWVMPMGILGVLAMPFALDAEFWRQMGYGIEWMDAVGLWVASLPGAIGRVTLFGTGPLLLATAALLVIGLLKTPLRFTGFVLAALAAIWAAFTPAPDVIVAADGRNLRRARPGRPVGVSSRRRRYVRNPRMAGRGCRRPRHAQSRSWRRDRVRSVRLHRQARGRQPCRLWT
jgi:competence protein ComEC